MVPASGDVFVAVFHCQQVDDTQYVIAEICRDEDSVLVVYGMHYLGVEVVEMQ